MERKAAVPITFMRRLAQTIVGPEIEAPLLRKFREVLIVGLKICKVMADFRVWQLGLTHADTGRRKGPLGYAADQPSCGLK